jgi:hypothetical protein
MSKSPRLYIDAIIFLLIRQDQSYFRIVYLPCGAATAAGEAAPVGFRAT